MRDERLQIESAQSNHLCKVLAVISDWKVQVISGVSVVSSFSLLLVFFIFGCRNGRQVVPTRAQVESELEGYKEWSIGRNRNIDIVEIYFLHTKL
jgi:hypothetical protein